MAVPAAATTALPLEQALKIFSMLAQFSHCQVAPAAAPAVAVPAGAPEEVDESDDDCAQSPADVAIPSKKRTLAFSSSVAQVSPPPPKRAKVDREVRDPNPSVVYLV